MSSNITDLNSGTSNGLSSEQAKIQSQVCDIVAEVLGVDAEIDATQTLKDLGADSIDIATLIVTLQDEFPSENTIDDSMMENIQTPAEITQLILTLSRT